jgi:hypothetical protein
LSWSSGADQAASRASLAVAKFPSAMGASPAVA